MVLVHVLSVKQAVLVEQACSGKKGNKLEYSDMPLSVLLTGEKQDRKET